MLVGASYSHVQYHSAACGYSLADMLTFNSRGYVVVTALVVVLQYGLPVVMLLLLGFITAFMVKQKHQVFTFRPLGSSVMIIMPFPRVSVQ